MEKEENGVLDAEEAMKRALSNFGAIYDFKEDENEEDVKEKTVEEADLKVAATEKNPDTFLKWKGHKEGETMTNEEILNRIQERLDVLYHEWFDDTDGCEVEEEGAEIGVLNIAYEAFQGIVDDLKREICGPGAEKEKG